MQITSERYSTRNISEIMRPVCDCTAKGILPGPVKIVLSLFPALPMYSVSQGQVYVALPHNAQLYAYYTYHFQSIYCPIFLDVHKYQQYQSLLKSTEFLVALIKHTDWKCLHSHQIYKQ